MERIGYLFYLVNPSSTYYEKADQVPHYITEAIPYFVGLIVLEQLITFWKGMQLMKLNDTITSAAQGILMEQSKVMVPSFNIIFYIYVYDNWRLITLPWDSVWIWIICLLLIDFGFYWFHRMSHEVNIFWAAHQTHHSSEYFNLSTALRQSVPQMYFHSLFYLPLALFMPPSVYLVHFEFNTLFQFWIHTELVDNLGPLGYLLNTPSHHRVHHGRNRYCIDKNYASVLIIWDRLFGTFQAEGEKVVYGLTHPVSTFSPLYLQCHSYASIWQRLQSNKGLVNKLSVLLKGPGWEEGKPRKGYIEDIPEVTASGPHQVSPYQPQVALWYQLYCLLHFLIVILFHVFLVERCVHVKLSQTTTFQLFAFMFLSLTSFGALMDGKPWAPHLELARCLTFFVIDIVLLPTIGLGASNLVANRLIRAAFSASLFIWFFQFAVTAKRLVSATGNCNVRRKESTLNE